MNNKEKEAPKIRLRQFKLGKQIKFLDKLNLLIHKDLMPELVSECKTKEDIETTVRLVDLLNETTDFVKESVCRNARIEAELYILRQQVQELLDKNKENNVEVK